MAHRNERNVDARSRKMPDDDDREERERFVHHDEQRFVHREDVHRVAHRTDVRRVVRDDDDDREMPERFVHDEETVRELIRSMTDAERARFIDERTRMFDDQEPGRLFGGNRTFGSEDRTRERPRSHNGSRFPERHRRR